MRKIENFICPEAVTVSLKLTLRALFPLFNLEKETGRFVEMYGVKAATDGS